MAHQVFPDPSQFDDWLGEDFESLSEDLGEEEIPVLALRDTVLYPHTVIPLFVGRERSLNAVDAAMSSGKRVIAVAQRDEEVEDPEPDDLYTIGTEVTIGRKLRMPDGTTNIWVQGLRRVRVNAYTQTDPYIAAEVEGLEETTDTSLSTEALMRAVLALYEKVVELSHNIPNDAYVAAMNVEEPGWLADLISSTLDLDVKERQELLEMTDATQRLQKVSILLASELDVLELENRIQTQIQQEVDRSQREYFLREQMRMIQNELGENDPQAQELDELRKKIAELDLPESVRERAEKELSRLASMVPASPETSVIRGYLDWIIELPWSTETTDNTDIREAERILERSHYGLPKAKERILEHIAVYQLAADKMKNPILCFVGPPGTGKTSIGRSIAEALGRNFVRVSLGGIHPRPPPHLRGGAPWPDHPGDEEGGHREPRLHDGRGRQDRARLPRRPERRAPRGAGSGAE